MRWIRRLPPHAQAWVLDYGVLSLFLAALGVASIAFFIWYRIEPHSHDGFHRVKVDATNTISDDDFTMTVFFHIDGAGPHRASTSNLALAQTVVDTACVERRKRASGWVTFRLVSAKNCDEISQ